MDKKFALHSAAFFVLLALAHHARAADDDLLFSAPIKADASVEIPADAPTAESHNEVISSPHQTASAGYQPPPKLEPQYDNLQDDDEENPRPGLYLPAVKVDTPAPPVSDYIAPAEESVDRNPGALPDVSAASLSSRSRSASSTRGVPGMEKNSRNIHAWFQSMVGEALQHSPEVRGALSDMDAANWGVKQVSGRRYPQVQVGGSAPFGAFGSGRTTRNNRSLSDSSGSVSITTTVFDWGKISADVEGAKEGLSASALLVKETRENIASTTMTELLNLSRYSESIEVAKSYVKRMKELVDMLSGIAAVDKGRASERVQAQARLLAAQAEQERLEHMYDNTNIKLVRLLGTEPKLMNHIRWDGGLMPLDTALSALPTHPTLQRGEAEVRAANAAAESVKADGLPKVNWVIQKSTAKDDYGDENAWYTGLNVQWNAFSGGSDRAAEQSALAKMRSAEEKQQTSRYELEYQIRNMVETRDSSLLRANSYVRLSAETDRVRDMFYRQWYNLGTRTLLDVLTAESDHFNNQLSAINNYYDGYISNVSVMYNAGILLNWLADLPIGNAKTAGARRVPSADFGRQ